MHSRERAPIFDISRYPTNMPREPLEICRMPREDRKTALQQDIAKVREEFYRRGESVAAWSRLHGFRPNAVYHVLSGQSLAARGESHRIAVALGIKEASPESLPTNGEKGEEM